MSGDVLLARFVAPARRRAALALTLRWLPWIGLVACAAWRGAGPGWGWGVLLAGAASLAVGVARAIGRLDRTWLVRRLDSRARELEDSSALLFAQSPPSPLQQLQRERIAARVAAIAPTTLADAWRWRGLVLAWVVALAAASVILLVPDRATPPQPSSVPIAQRPPGPPRLIGGQLRVVPPAYTGLPARTVTTLDARAPAGSRIEWRLAFAPDPAAVALRLQDGQSVALSQEAKDWRGALRLDRSMLYRVAPAGAAAVGGLHRLEAVADTAPEVRVVEPTSGLVLVRPGQREWRVVFEARDDHGVDAAGRLTLTVAQGEGETVTFREHATTLRGTGDPRRRRFVARLNLAALGLQPGGDLVAQLTVADRRSPSPQRVRGPGVILRWPPPRPTQVGGLELMTERVLPAYFRSQRQIIIDAEALIARRRQLDAEAFLQKSDALGVDQHALRLRYGQFLGEESASRPQLPTADAENTPPPEEHGPEDGHDHAAPAAPAPVFGQVEDATAQFGHAHDTPEAATLLDDGTRSTLRGALGEMWQSELHLRQGAPQQALPFAHRALALIKQVQQATRIYLPRVGPQLPPLDLARRLTGKREGLQSRAAALDPLESADLVPAGAWRTLATPGARVDLAPLERWVRDHAARLADPLSLLAAIDAVRNEPRCERCRAALRGRLWAAMTRPPAQIRRRGDGGIAGRRYLDGLR